MVATVWCEPIEAWLSTLVAAGRRAETIRLRRYQLERVAAGVAPVGPWEVTTEQLVAWLGRQDWERETRRSWRSALQGFYRWAHRRGLAAVDPTFDLERIKPSVPAPHPTPEDIVLDALASAGDRERLMVRLAAELGMRRGEVCLVHSGDLERRRDGWWLRVHGKGGKIRELPIEGGLAAAVRRCGFGYAFPGAIDGHLSPAWTGKLVSRLMPAAWSMHSLRHRFGTAAHDQENNMEAVRQLLGHASIETTRRYVLVKPAVLRRTVAAVARL